MIRTGGREIGQEDLPDFLLREKDEYECGFMVVAQ